MIIISANNNEEVLIFPIEPNNIPIVSEKTHTIFQTFQSGDITLINKNSGLKIVTIDSLFPDFKNKYTFQEPGSEDAQRYLDFFEKWVDIPIRIYISDKQKKEVINMPCVVTSFTHSRDKANDVVYSLVLQEFKFV